MFENLGCLSEDYRYWYNQCRFHLGVKNYPANLYLGLSSLMTKKIRSKQKKIIKKPEKVKKLHVVLSEVKTMKEILAELKKLNKNLENFNDSQRMLEINKTYLASIDKTLEEINFTMRSIRWSMSK